jgi:protein O-GlcNAc transferase
LQNISAESEEIWKIAQSNFLLAYQGQNDRELQGKYADFLRTLIVRHRRDLLATPKRDFNRKRIRVVFVSSFFRECTVGHYFRSWITDLDAQKFERIVVHTGWQPDSFGIALQQQCDQFIAARGGVLQTAELIRSLAADIVIYPEVGMGTMNYWLTNMRLAPTQIAAWGHPVTTGSREMDYLRRNGASSGCCALHRALAHVARHWYTLCDAKCYGNQYHQRIAEPAER